MVMVRVETPDPMVIPLFILDRDALYERDHWYSYSYGLMYGVLIGLLIYNAMIFVGIRSKRYLYYSVYLGFFLLMNLSYTGHAYQWLWPEAPGWQVWAHPVLMIFYGLSGLLFASEFLGTRRTLPRRRTAMSPAGRHQERPPPCVDAGGDWQRSR